VPVLIQETTLVDSLENLELCKSKIDWDHQRAYLNIASTAGYSVPTDVAERIVSEFSSVVNGRKLTGQDLVRRLETAR
jgi:hypothetical protein